MNGHVMIIVFLIINLHIYVIYIYMFVVSVFMCYQLITCNFLSFCNFKSMCLMSCLFNDLSFSEGDLIFRSNESTRPNQKPVPHPQKSRSLSMHPRGGLKSQ